MNPRKFLLLTAATAFCLGGCGSKNSPSSPSSATPTPIPTPLSYKSSIPANDPYPIGLSQDASFLFTANFPGNQVDVTGPYGLAATWTSYSGTAVSIVSSISVAADGAVYLVENGWQKVDEFSSYGTPVTSWSGYNGTPFNYPYGIAASPNGNVYVADQDNMEVEEFSPEAAPVTEWSLSTKPIVLAVSPLSPYDIYVSLNGGHQIQEFTANGNSVTTWGTEASSQNAGNGQFSEIEGIAVGPNGNVYATDGTGPCQTGTCFDNLVEEFSPHGTFLTQWGGPGTGPGQFNGSTGGIAAANGDIFVSDPGNNRVQVFGP